MKRTRSYSEFPPCCDSTKRHRRHSAHVRSPRASPPPSTPALTEEALHSLQQSYSTTAHPLTQQEALGGLVKMAAPPIPEAQLHHTAGAASRGVMQTPVGFEHPVR
ncbi:hypothetical protein IAQ61_005971 [Plenodomus lingam]|uniref:uncharacterized protein n=1 Tax=Leptosphaeria maculans TaxID=5022 RepID=UPI0033278BF2|nr:hypothetical protein IAQ61_005971 [Plenodomus lingam]